MTYNFINKTVLVTGGNSGIGEACAMMFAEQGAQVMIAARREKESLIVVDKIKKKGGQAKFVQVDMADKLSIKHMIEETIRSFGAIDFAINNAGIVGPAQVPLIDYAEEDYDKVMSINVKGVFLSMQLELRHMLERKRGVIINMSSLAGLKSGRAGSVYTTSKHAVIGMTRSAAKEYARHGIRVNALCPALIETPMIVDAKFYDEKPIAEGIPVGRLGKPDEVASAACWLCSDLASFTTGIALPIDGGILS